VTAENTFSQSLENNTIIVPFAKGLSNKPPDRHVRLSLFLCFKTTDVIIPLTH
jgi:hypothetical protein